MSARQNGKLRLNGVCVTLRAHDDFDFRMLLDPIRQCSSGGAGFEDVCNDPTFKIDNNRSVIKRLLRQLQSSIAIARRGAPSGRSDVADVPSCRKLQCR